MISLKKFLASDGQAAAIDARLAGLILEATSCYPVEADPAERLAFQTSLRALTAQLESANGEAALALVSEAIKSMEAYNGSVQRALTSQVTELQSIVSMFTRSLLQISKSSTQSAGKLHQIERQIEKSSHTDDLRALKAQLEKSLDAICVEAAAQEQRSNQIHNQIAETMSRPEAAAILTEAVSDLDLVTGLPNFRSAETAIRAALGAGRAAYAVLLFVDRVEVINSRFGFAVGDRILMLFGQHLAQRFANEDQLFRWRGPSFLALIDRPVPEATVRSEVTRIVSTRLEQEIDLGGRSVLLPIAASWTLTSLENSTPEAVFQKLGAFAAKQTGHPDAA